MQPQPKPDAKEAELKADGPAEQQQPEAGVLAAAAAEPKQVSAPAKGQQPEAVPPEQPAAAEEVAAGEAEGGADATSALPQNPSVSSAGQDGTLADGEAQVGKGSAAEPDHGATAVGKGTVEDAKEADDAVDPDPPGTPDQSSTLLYQVQQLTPHGFRSPA